MTICTVNGCFDGPTLHQGHTFFLGYAAALADNLIVGINSDEYIVKYKRFTPFCNQEERKDRLLELGFIRNVVVFEEDNPLKFIGRVSPDVHCTGVEYIDACPEKEFCLMHGIRLVFIPRIGKYSTSSLD